MYFEPVEFKPRVFTPKPENTVGGQIAITSYRNLSVIPDPNGTAVELRFRGSKAVEAVIEKLTILRDDMVRLELKGEFNASV